MTREEAKELLPIIQAFAEGKNIEYRSKGFNEGWKKVTQIPGLSFKAFEYRIKQEPKYRPFKNKEECWKEMQNHHPFGWIKREKGGYFCFTMVLDDCSYDDLLKTFAFADGTPFGIKEE